MDDKCDYCHTRIANYKLKNGKNCCEKFWQRCPVHRKLKSNIMKEVMNRPESKKRISELRTGAVDSEETKEKKRQALIGNDRKKGKKESKKTRLKKSKSHTYTLEDYKKIHPLLLQIEQLRHDPITGKIQGRCKNHKCSNSKEQDGWFILKPRQIENRLKAIYNHDGLYFYCSEKCKRECILYNYQETTNKYEKCYTEAEYQIFRKTVLERDSYECQYCGSPAEHVHHELPQKLEPFFALDLVLGWSVCKKCHYEKGHPKGSECSTGKLKT